MSGKTTLSTQPYKGARDFYPPDKRLQKYMFTKLREVSERYGYEEYDAPILEPLEIYLAKTGEEIVNEQTYVFEDRGGRKVVIRPEMTPTVSRMVAAKRQELAYPLRWYSIPNLWRYERPQRGRLREHWQFNLDIFGVDSIQAEIEVISVVHDIFQAFGATQDMYTIRLNSRKLMDEALKVYLKLTSEEAQAISKLIDRKSKMTDDDFISTVDQALSAKSKEAKATEKILEILSVEEISGLPKALLEHDSVKQLQMLKDALKGIGVHNAVFDMSLIRGFDYYTDIVFEVFDNHPDNNRAMLGGGRYDGLVGLFGVQPIPTVGFGWGDVTLANFLELHHLLPEISAETDLYVVLIGDVLDHARSLIQKFREAGLKVAVDYSGKKVGDQIKVANKKGIAFVLMIGDDELKSGEYSLKDLTHGHEQKLSADVVIQTVLKERR